MWRGRKVDKEGSEGASERRGEGERGGGGR